jgi:hypothetical protein
VLSDFGGIKSDWIQMPQFLNKSPKKRGLARTRHTGNQDVDFTHSEFFRMRIAEL